VLLRDLFLGLTAWSDSLRRIVHIQDAAIASMVVLVTAVVKLCSIRYGPRAVRRVSV